MELVYLREFISTQCRVLLSLSFEFETILKEKADQPYASLKVDFVLKEFHKLHNAIQQTQKQALIFLENPFERLPHDILNIVFSFLPFEGLGRMACVSKKFNALIGVNDLWKRLCLDWWGEQLSQNEELQNSLKMECKNIPGEQVLIWGVVKANSFNSTYYNWKFVAKCIKQQKYELKDNKINLGPSQLQGEECVICITLNDLNVELGTINNGCLNGEGAKFWYDGIECKVPNIEFNV